jgi:hypothetical protein
MNPEASPMSSQEREFVVDRDFIVAHQETVLDFFGDNRDSWYFMLNSPNPSHNRVNLVDSGAVTELNTTEEEEDGSLDIIPPLSLRLLLDKADAVVDFFAATPAASEALKEYYEHELKEKTKDTHPAVDGLYGGVI